MQDDTPAIRFTPGKGGYYRDDSRTKPTGGSGGKDFSKILSKQQRESDGKNDLGVDEDGQNGTSDELAALEEMAQEQVSLFTMSKTQNRAQKPFVKKGKESADSAFSSIEGTKSPDPRTPIAKAASTLDSQEADEFVPIDAESIGAGQEAAKKISTPIELIASSGKEAQLHDEKTRVRKKSASTAIAHPSDQAPVNPLAGVQTSALAELRTDFAVEKPIPPVKSVQELINQMVKQIQSIETDGKTETTVTLKHPPLFDGAVLVVTSFPTARGEFNVTFENLKLGAQQLLNNQQHKENLLQGLEQKGYHVHILTATTLDEQRIYTADADEARRERGQERQQDQSNPEGRQRNG